MISKDALNKSLVVYQILQTKLFLKTMPIKPIKKEGSEFKV